MTARAGQCFAGCDNAEVVKALGLSQQDMFARPSDMRRTRAEPKTRRRGSTPSPEAAIEGPARQYGRAQRPVYVYKSSEGAEVFRVYRFDFTDADTGKPTRLSPCLPNR